MTSTAVDMSDIILQADASGAPYRLEHVRGRLKVEASPASRHQMTAKEIEASLRPLEGTTSGCACYSLQDVLIRFPDRDRSLKRPDIAVFCEKPPKSDEALNVLPDAVIEIISLSYEEKDLGEDGAPFYLACGVRDVIIVDPRAGTARHYRPGRTDMLATPARIDLSCGCQVEV
ncbi:MAG: Uma2 family endonuclease [Roseiflexaceae bacterium]|nr:Uma2 family endonuclease [Roseiflexaceae bacterium]